MRAVDLAEKLRELLEAKINKCAREMLDTHVPIEVERLQAQIMAFQWIQEYRTELLGMKAKTPR